MIFTLVPYLRLCTRCQSIPVLPAPWSQSCDHRGGGSSPATLWATANDASELPLRGVAYSDYVCISQVRVSHPACSQLGQGCASGSLCAGSGTGWRPYSTSFLRFNTSPSNAHSNRSIYSPGGDSSTPFSMSWGPRCGTPRGKASWKRARNMTMN